MILRLKDVSVQVRGRAPILDRVSFEAGEGQFLAVLGENGAGKTTLLDLLMGFRAPTSGEVRVLDAQPHLDPWKTRSSIAYLSEKVDMPGDWSMGEFLRFHRAFYPTYSEAREHELVSRFKVRIEERIGNLSAGEIRRAQIVAALSIHPKLIVVDEVTAVLDIIGRRRFMETLTELRRGAGCTVIMATNILEDLEAHATDILLLQGGRVVHGSTMPLFLDGSKPRGFSAHVAELLEKSMNARA
ncbi:MAG TPA: ABC transporter ATP-binding protein [Bdellovibrionota bacterium]|nr:ABC transporter ATP-binding protein [Bdellovibrionota bacterium]